MGKKIVRVTSSKRDAIIEKNRINANLKSRGIKREAYICTVSKPYVKKLTRKGYPIAEKNYAICMRNKYIPNTNKPKVNRILRGEFAFLPQLKSWVSSKQFL